MNRTLPFALSLASVLTLAGCAGTASDFECNATTSDHCMTIEQANEKARRLEESAVKPDAAALPRLAEGNFRTASAQPLTPPPVPAPSVASRSAPPGGSHFVANPFAHSADVKPASQAAPVVAPQPTYESIVDPRPLRLGEKTAGLWIAPYIDTRDVYHQPGRVFFVVKPAAWGKPRVN
ncbi:type IV conjugative transfer system lipoprotein TraV [Enterobacter hormaechei]|uniref:type IV conjugative transfer system lipoprotein TraV n=1 Tax=Enterobacter hormaechei TaxID=158836 RepID=UPI002175FA22|nr:type IV conjugative transfer system lipoprotein TraV [Enterobacter hormaechei]UVZ93241.1 type IV conjugative transfer system lipoprotein TraV [Enterobacter hormaechei]